MILINGQNSEEWMKIRMAEKEKYNAEKLKECNCGFMSDEYRIHLQITNKLKGGAK